MYKNLKEVYTKVYGEEPIIKEFNSEEIENNVDKIKLTLSDRYNYYVFMKDNTAYEFRVSDNEDLIYFLRDNFGFEIHEDMFINKYTEYSIRGKKYKIIFDTDYLDILEDDIKINDEINYIDSLLEEEVYKDDGIIYVKGSNLDWMGRSGYKIIRDKSKIFSSLIPNYDAKMVVYQNIEDAKDIFINIYSHDTPMGSLLELIPLIDICDIVQDMEYDYERGDKKGSSVQEFIRDFKERTKINIDEKDIEFDSDRNCFIIFEGEINIHVQDDLSTINYITYDEDYLEERLINNL
ncbi:MAG: hypothetical protein N2749_01040 [Clostridia bacterium]|nr:hypothetical protein [Clostridia bacterium]